MSAIHLPQQRPASGPASATAAPAGEPGWSRLLLVAGSRAALAVVLCLVVWSVLPAALGWSPRVIMSGSMEPRIHVGDVVVDRPIDPTTLTEGRIMTVTDPDHPEKTRTHRFQQRDEDGKLVTRGDANEAADSTPVDPDDVLGVAAIRVPHVGLPVTWLAQGQLAPVGIAVTVLLLLGLAATTPLRLTADDAAETDDTDDPGDPGDSGDSGTGPDDADDSDGDAGLTILDPAAAARRDRLRAPALGGFQLSSSLRFMIERHPRVLRIAVASLGALVATTLTVETTYAAFLEPTTNGNSAFATAADFRPYRTAVLADSPSFFWRLDETSGTVVDDETTANNDGTLSGSYAWGQPGALDSEAQERSLSLSSAVINGNAQVAGPARFSLEAWIKTTTSTGGRILGFGNATGQNASSTIDRQLYVGANGRVYLGVGSARTTVVSNAALNDGAWHHLVGTYVTGTNGMRLYVDGVQQTVTATGNLQSFNGYWRAGAENLPSWTGAPDAYYDGNLAELAVYPTTLSAARVKAHYDAGHTP
ncbi:signal peptidase I [Nocardioides aurantiacus]|uniref:Signal peptidase I n=1 Tax=Nocardioides aurantiacus TaxID=86796 RepID=A0A3N2CTQ1_9ACTN|nr:signal peptidase I [Nocardioides aurantiacus]ROR90913.1 signal peptidase I [Nocardioides aurantiacus]